MLRKPCPLNDEMSTGGEVANALVCKTSIRGFNSLPVLQTTIVSVEVTDPDPLDPIPEFAFLPEVHTVTLAAALNEHAPETKQKFGSCLWSAGVKTDLERPFRGLRFPKIYTPQVAKSGIFAVS